MNNVVFSQAIFYPKITFLNDILVVHFVLTLHMLQ